jgi:hypothetical protein
MTASISSTILAFSRHVAVLKKQISGVLIFDFGIYAIFSLSPIFWYILPSC